MENRGDGEMEDMVEWVDNECVLMHEKGHLELQRSRLELSQMEEGSVLLRTELAEVCGTDVHLLHGRLDLVPYPIIPGHVAVGRVYTSIGAVCDVSGAPVSKGDAVTFLDVLDTCNSCLTCLVDKQSTRCPQRRVIGITCVANGLDIKGLLGCWSSYIYLPPKTKIIRLPDALPPTVFMAGGCGLPTALHAMDRASIKLMDRVIVQGSGPVGLLAAILALHSGAGQQYFWYVGRECARNMLQETVSERFGLPATNLVFHRGADPISLQYHLIFNINKYGQVIVIGAPAHRLEVVKAFGIDATINIQETRNSSDRQRKVEELTEGRLGDVVIEATGRPEAVAEGLALCRNGGTYVVVGQYTDNGDASINPHYLINRKHVVMKGCWGSDFSHFYRGVQFMAKHSNLPWHQVVSTVFSLKDARKALSCVENLEVFKALIKPEFPFSS